jgi:hypothetical protein
VAVAVIDIKCTGCPHTINNVIEYADALIFKLSTIDIHSAQQLYLAVKDGHQVINNKLSQAGHSKLKIDTTSFLRKECLKSSNFTDNQSVHAYKDTIVMIGEDDKVMTLMIIPKSELLFQLLLHYSPAMSPCAGQIMSPPSSLVPGSVPWRVSGRSSKMKL